MKVLKYRFSVGTTYVGSTVRDDFEFEFDDDATQEEIDNEVEQAWVEFRNQHCDGGWKLISEKVIED